MSTFKLIVANETVEVSIKEYLGQRVVTFRDIDNLHRRPDGTAKRTFRTNSKYLIENEDFFIISPDQKDEIRTFQIPNRGITVFTESGYLMLVKSFTDELAWQVQRQLVKSYFKIKEIVPTSHEDIMIFALQSQKEMKQRLEILEIQNTQLKLVVDNEIWITDHQKSDIQEAVNKRTGRLKHLGYDAHFQGIYRALKDHFSVPKYDKIKRVDFDRAIDLIAGWYPKKKDEAI